MVGRLCMKSFDGVDAVDAVDTIEACGGNSIEFDALTIVDLIRGEVL